MHDNHLPVNLRMNNKRSNKNSALAVDDEDDDDYNTMQAQQDASDQQFDPYAIYSDEDIWYSEKDLFEVSNDTFGYFN